MGNERATVSGKDIMNERKANGAFKTEASLAPSKAKAAADEAKLQQGTGMGQLQKASRLKRKEPTPEELAAIISGEAADTPVVENATALNDDGGGVEVPELVEDAPAPKVKGKRQAGKPAVQVQRPTPVIHQAVKPAPSMTLSSILGAKFTLQVNAPVDDCPLRTFQGFENCQPEQTELGAWRLKVRSTKTTLGAWQRRCDVQADTLMQVRTGIYFDNVLLANGYVVREIPGLMAKHEQEVRQAVIDDNHELVVSFAIRGNILPLSEGADIVDLYLF